MRMIQDAALDLVEAGKTYPGNVFSNHGIGKDVLGQTVT